MIDQRIVKAKVKVLQLNEFSFPISIGTRSYQVVYKQKMFTAQFSGIDYFEYRNLYFKQFQDLEVNVNRWENHSWLELFGAITELSFVVENQPAGSERDCIETDLEVKAHLSCSGDIQVRKLTSDP